MKTLSVKSLLFLFSTLSVFIISNGRTQDLLDDEEHPIHGLKYWQERILNSKKGGKNLILLEMLEEAAKDEKGHMQTLLREQGPSLFYTNETHSKEDFQRSLFLIFRAHDLNKLKEVYKIEEEKSDLLITDIFKTIFFLYAPEKMFLSSLKEELKITLEWNWVDPKAKENITSLIASIESELVVSEKESEKKEKSKTIRGKDGKEMVLIPAGSFECGPHRLIGNNIQAVHLDAYYIDRTEVTYKEYVNFLSAYYKKNNDTASMVKNMFAKTNNSILAQEGKILVTPILESHPITAIDFYAARTYCKFYEKSLPNELQWEKAAKGPHHRTYPWGNEWDLDKIGTVDATTPVGSHPQDISPYGVLDMAGNVAEWTDTLGMSLGEIIIRGGSFGWIKREEKENEFKTFTSHSWKATDTFTDLGFRCVSAVENIKKEK